MRWADWVHVVVSTYGNWLPGDPRGFRDRGHRVHSAGEYRDTTPERKHAGLYGYARARLTTPVTLAPSLRPAVVNAFAEKLQQLGCTCRIAAMAEVHGHALVRVGSLNAKPVVGRAKQHASFKIRDQLPGTVWAGGCGVTRIEDEDHFRRTIAYISDHQHEGAALWVHPSKRSG